MENDYGVTADGVPSLNLGLARLPNWGHRAALLGLCRLLERVEFGSLRLVLPGGETLQFTGSRGNGPAAELVIRDPRAVMRLVRGGDIGFAESYLDRQWDSPDLMALMRFATGNQQVLNDAMGGGAVSLLNCTI